MKQMRNKKGFTLIELLLAMALMAILIVVFIASFNVTLKRGRDQRRKNDLSQLQKALELYYEDNATYPTFDIFSGPSKKFCKTASCGSSETVYMVKTPSDPNSSYIYRYVYETPVGGISSKYYLYSYIENGLDQGSGVSLTGYAGVAGFTGTQTCDTLNTAATCRYYVSSSNATPLTPNP